MLDAIVGKIQMQHSSVSDGKRLNSNPLGINPQQINRVFVRSEKGCLALMLIS